MARIKRTYSMDELMKKKLLTKDESVFYLQICEQTLDKLIKTGEFYPLFRIGHGRGKIFVNREKLDQWISEQDASMKVIRA